MELELSARHTNDANSLHQRAILAMQSGDHRQAEQWLIQILCLNGRSASTYCNLGAVLLAQSRLEGALSCLEQAIQLDPRCLPAYINRTYLFVQQSRRTAAMRSCDELVELWPTHINAHACRIKVLLDLNCPQRALYASDEFIALHPHHAGAHFQQGRALFDLGRLEEAITSYERAIALEPMHTAALEHRSVTMFRLARYEQAVEACNQLIKLFPQWVTPYVNCGGALRELGAVHEAEKACDRAIELDPCVMAAYINRAAALCDMGRSKEALDCYLKAIELRREDAMAHFGASLACLRIGEWERGWGLYEWRSKPGGPVPPRTLPGQQWHGREDLHGKTIFVHCEQGLGDTIQFCRYVDDVVALGANVVLEVQPELFSLFESFEGSCEVVSESRPDFDYYCSLLSLPFLFKTNISTIPARVPYFKCSREKIDQWAQRLGVCKKPRVGLVWAGGARPDQPMTWAVNKRRNIALAKLAPLRNEEIEFYSLQKGEAAESELIAAKSVGWDGPNLIDVSHLLQDFSDTAALIHHLDLVISVDTSTAHLAGALSKPIWILNRFDNCWRWLIDREDTPWYPTARLYRQDKIGEWEGVIARVAHDLRGFARGLPLKTDETYCGEHRGFTNIRQRHLDATRLDEGCAPDGAVHVLSAAKQTVAINTATTAFPGSPRRPPLRQQVVSGHIRELINASNQALTLSSDPMAVHADLATALRSLPNLKYTTLLLRGGIGDLLQCVPFLRSCGANVPRLTVLTHFDGASRLLANLGVGVTALHKYSNLEELKRAERLISSRSIDSQCPRQQYWDSVTPTTAFPSFPQKRPVLGVHLGGSGFSISTQKQFGVVTKDLPTALLEQLLSTDYFNVVLFGSRAEIDAMKVAESSCLMFASYPDVMTSLAIARECNALVGSDSAVKTMTAMLKIPTIVWLGDYRDSTRDRIFIDPYVRDRVMHVYRFRDKLGDLAGGMRFTMTALATLGLCPNPK